jgi:hypothetical protein
VLCREGKRGCRNQDQRRKLADRRYQGWREARKIEHLHMQRRVDRAAVEISLGRPHRLIRSHRNVAEPIAGPRVPRLTKAVVRDAVTERPHDA